MKSSKFLVAATAVAAAIAAAPASATAFVDVTSSIQLGTWTDPVTSLTNQPDGSITLGIHPHDHTYTFSDPTPNLQLGWYADNPGANDVNSIATLIKSSSGFGLTTSSVLTNIAQADISTQARITSSSAFNYLAVHVGGGELLFHWTAPITAFTIKSDNLSNFRAYYAAPVPEPETYAMLIAGLGLVGFMARRRKQQ